MEKFIVNNRSYEALSPQGFVIHATDTPGATAQNEWNYFNSAYRGASVHYFVDWTEIINAIPEDEVAWHAGYKANHQFLSVEMCESSNTDSTLFQEVWSRTVWLVANACFVYGWKAQTQVFSHYDISQMYHETDHTDPIDYLARYGRTWSELLKAIDEELKNIEEAHVQSTGGGMIVQNLILVSHGPDERAAGYLADHLKAPLAYLDGVQKEDLDSAKNVFVVGGASKPVDRAILLSGADRYATCQKVLDYIRTGLV